MPVDAQVRPVEPHPRRRAEAAAAAQPALARGPLLAVCGLCGGAGATTFALLAAADAALADEGAALVCDASGATAGLAALAGVRSRSLPEAAAALAAGEPLAGLFAQPRAGLRVMAGGPRLDHATDEAAARRLLADGRAAHALTVVDCGTLDHEAGRIARAQATHVAWVVPATIGGLRRAAPVLDAHVPTGARELLVARATPEEPHAALEALAALAALRDAPLVLLPAVADLAGGDLDAALDAAAVTLTALRGALAR